MSQHRASTNHFIKVSTWVPILLISYNIAANLSNDIYLPSMAILGKLFATSESMVQLTMTAWYLGVAIPQFFVGLWSEKFGRKPILFIGGLCFILATFVCALAPTIFIFIIARFFQGVGVCTLNVTTFSVLPDLYSTSKRIRMMTYLTMCGYLSPILGPTLGAYILVMLSWHVNFLVISFLSAVSLMGLWFCLPETHPPSCKLKLSLLETGRLYREHFKNKALMMYFILFCAINSGLILYLTASPFMVINQLHVKPQYYGLVQLCVFTAGAAGALFLNYRIRLGVNKGARKALIISGLAIIFLSALGNLLGAWLFKHSLLAYVLPMLSYAFGFGLCSSLLINEMMIATEGQQGLAAAFIGFGGASSGALGSYAVTLVYDGTNFSLALTTSLLMAVAYLMAWRLKFRE